MRHKGLIQSPSPPWKMNSTAVLWFSRDSNSSVVTSEPLCHHGHTPLVPRVTVSCSRLLWNVLEMLYHGQLRPAIQWATSGPCRQLRHIFTSCAQTDSHRAMTVTTQNADGSKLCCSTISFTFRPQWTFAYWFLVDGRMQKTQESSLGSFLLISLHPCPT